MSSSLDEIDNDLRYSLVQTWDVIGGDCLRAKHSCHGGNVNATTMSKEEVVDVVIDQVRNQGFLAGDSLAYWNSLTFEQMQNFTRTCFQYEVYGW